MGIEAKFCRTLSGRPICQPLSRLLMGTEHYRDNADTMFRCSIYILPLILQCFELGDVSDPEIQLSVGKWAELIFRLRIAFDFFTGLVSVSEIYINIDNYKYNDRNNKY